MSDARQLVAVTGASGGIGKTLLPELLKQHRVRALFRSEGAAAADARRRGAETVIGGLADERALDALVQGATAVIHSAASVMRELSTAHATNVEGSVRLARCAARAGCRRFVHISTIAVYLGNRGREGVFAEDLPLQENWRQDAYSRTKLRAEIELRRMVDESAEGAQGASGEVGAGAGALELVIVRPTCVYGPEIEAWTKLPLQMFRKGIPMMIGRGAGEMDAVHVDDVVQALLLCVSHPAAAGQTFNLGDISLPTREFLGYFARMVGRPLRGIPRGVAKLIINGGGEVERRLGARLMANVSPNRLRLVDFCTSGAAGRPKFPSSKLRDMLGYKPSVSLTHGMLQTHEWAVMNGLARRQRFSHEERMYAFTPEFTALPECEEDVRRVVERAAAVRKRVRMAGSLHSFSPLPATDAVCLSPERMRALVRADGPLATVQPGMRLWELNDALAEHGLALPALGAVALQTVAGAVATGTHGGSLRHASVADAVERVRLVTADGSALPLARGDERLNGALLSMGMCGIVTELTLRCVPAYWLRSRVRVLAFDEVLERFQELHSQHEFCDMNWYPLADRVEVMTCERVDGPIPDRETRRGHAPGANALTRWFVRKGSAKFHAGRWRALHRRVVRGYVGTWYPEREGRSDFVLAYQRYRPSGMPMVDFDSAVPFERAVDALRAVRERMRAESRFPVLGMRIRAERAEPFWLSGAYGRDTCWIESFHPAPGLRWARLMHRALEPFQYRPHWGKNVEVAPDYWRAVFPKWDAFIALRAQMDPRGMFLNEYLWKIGMGG